MEVGIINWQIIIIITTVVAYKQIIVIVVITGNFTIQDIIMDRIINYIKANYIKANYIKANYIKANYIKANYIKANYIKATIELKIKDNYLPEKIMVTFIRIDNYFIWIFINIIYYIQGHTSHLDLSFYFFSSFQKLQS